MQIKKTIALHFAQALILSKFFDCHLIVQVKRNSFKKYDNYLVFKAL